MITRISGVSSTQRLRKYSYQMLQASFTPSVFPISTYPIQQLHRKQQDWADNTSRTLSRFYDNARELMKAAAPFDRLERQKHDEGTASAEDDTIAQTRVLVDRYNQLHQFLTDEQDKFELDIADSFQRILRSNREQYESIGITTQADGSLELDEKVLKNNIELQPEYVNTVLHGSGGLVTRLYAKTGQLQELPSSTFTSAQANPYELTFLTSLFSRQAASTGLFFNQVF